MGFEKMIADILSEQDSVTHHNERGETDAVLYHQHRRKLAVMGLEDWVKAQVAMERERCARRAEKEAASCRLAWKVAHETWSPMAYEVRRWQFAAEVAEVIANGIRARGNEE